MLMRGVLQSTTITIVFVEKLVPIPAILPVQFSCTQENLRAALQLIGHIAARQGSLPILSNVLIRAADHALELVTTNLELGMTYHLRGRIKEEGVFTTNAKLLADIIQLLPKQRIDARVVDGELELRCGVSNTRVHGMDAAEFPLIPSVDRGGGEVRVRAAMLRDAIGQVAFAAAVGGARPELDGVLWRFDGMTLTITATDSYRLAERTLPLTVSTISTGTAVVVPARTVQELLRVIGVPQDEGEEVAEVVITPTMSQFVVEVGNLTVISRLVDATYPDYTPILPTSTTTRVIVPRAELHAAARAANLFSRTGIHDVHLRMLPAERRCIVRSENTQLGQHEAILDADITGEELTTILNGRYLLEGLTAIPTERVAIECTKPAAPIVLRPVTESGAPEGVGTYLYIIMPIKE